MSTPRKKYPRKIPRILKPRKAVEQICGFIDEGMDLISAGACIGIEPEQIDRWMAEKRVAIKIRKHMALYEHKLIKIMNSGEVGFGKAKAAYEMLRSTNARFTQKSTVVVENAVRDIMGILQDELDEATFERITLKLAKSK